MPHGKLTQEHAFGPDALSSGLTEAVAILHTLFWAPHTSRARPRLLLTPVLLDLQSIAKRMRPRMCRTLVMFALEFAELQGSTRSAQCTMCMHMINVRGTRQQTRSPSMQRSVVFAHPQGLTRCGAMFLSQSQTGCGRSFVMGIRSARWGFRNVVIPSFIAVALTNGDVSPETFAFQASPLFDATCAIRIQVCTANLNRFIGDGTLAKGLFAARDAFSREPFDSLGLHAVGVQ